MSGYHQNMLQSHYPTCISDSKENPFDVFEENGKLTCVIGKMITTMSTHAYKYVSANNNLIIRAV